MNERPPAKGFAPDGARLGAKGEAAGQVGVLLVNLGTPDGADAGRCAAISRNSSPIRA